MKFVLAWTYMVSRVIKENDATFFKQTTPIILNSVLNYYADEFFLCLIP